ncbi:Small ribosomal subunit protein uS17-like protein [Drosera capensis]
MKPVVGIVVSNKMQKSVVVAVDRLFHHKLYNRYIKRATSSWLMMRMISATSATGLLIAVSFVEVRASFL